MFMLGLAAELCGQRRTYPCPIRAPAAQVAIVALAGSAEMPVKTVLVFALKERPIMRKTGLLRQAESGGCEG